ncbi:DUF2931 family protein [Olivibacter domesticus]|uniref:DUF2931 family protein n=1 Tax=Olivibacter domesticus TaxID=407022 RepID=A0A1H7GR35_OLID1|nr:DUF2931 family protein [Olivibacter domesticus]SEK40509.1 Protein of unknown function [Olivibacter domesticus]
MKRINIFNKAFIAVTVILAILFAHKIYSYKSWKRYFYTSSVSNPEAFPIHIFGIWFITEDVERNGDFYKDRDNINLFYSDWGRGESYEAYAPEFMPQSLFVEYMDFRTKKYYLDTIALPKERMFALFSAAKSNNQLTDLSYGRRKMGLEFHVGIANEGNIIVWLLGNNYQVELYRKQIDAKPFPDQVISSKDANPDVARNKEERINSFFHEIPDSVKRKIMELDITGVQYKDSIPVYFDHIQP